MRADRARDRNRKRIGRRVELDDEQHVARIDRVGLVHRDVHRRQAFDQCLTRNQPLGLIGREHGEPVGGNGVLAIFKVLFAREKDWRDLREMLLAQAPGFDASYVIRWLERIVAPGDERLARFRSLVAERSAG